MGSAGGVDILVSFIKWTGLRLLMPAFEDLRVRNVPVRVITTSYMGASDATAIEWPARLPNCPTSWRSLPPNSQHTGTAGNLFPLINVQQRGNPFRNIAWRDE